MTYSISAQQGQNLLTFLSGQVTCPAQLDDLKFDASEQAYVNHRMGLARGVLLAESTRAATRKTRRR